MTAQRPCELASHSHWDRLEEFIQNTNLQLITSDIVSKELNISKRQAGQLLREYLA